MKYIIKKLKEINKDLLYGLEELKKNTEENDIDILLSQHKEACAFRDNKKAFEKAYEHSSNGIISSKERISMNTFNRAYEREKTFVKLYSNNS